MSSVQDPLSISHHPRGPPHENLGFQHLYQYSISRARRVFTLAQHLPKPLFLNKRSRPVGAFLTVIACLASTILFLLLLDNPYSSKTIGRPSSWQTIQDINPEPSSDGSVSSTPPEHPVVELSEDSIQILNQIFKSPNAPEYDETYPWVTENYQGIRDLLSCEEAGNCKANQAKLVVLQSFYFRGALRGHSRGEDIWARSVINALRGLGYTPYWVESVQQAYFIHKQFPQNLIAVIVESDYSFSCFDGRQVPCLKTTSHPSGIPIWKIFSFHFWVEPVHPLGAKWVLSPEPYHESQGDEYINSTYLGYSVEPGCRKHPFIPPSQRSKNQVYVFAKWLAYFAEGWDNAWPLDFYADSHAQTGGNFVGGVARIQDGTTENGPEVPEDVPHPIKNLGLLPQPQFVGVLSRSRLLLGLGQPKKSPTPYEALCMGVPFVNPILNWDLQNPQDRDKWRTQHQFLRRMDPPYVYHVFKDDRAGFIDAIREALVTPLTERYILSRMTMQALEGRLHDILQMNWTAAAEEILSERIRTGDGELFLI